MSVERWKYYDITHLDYVICNPSRIEKLDWRLRLFDLSKASEVCTRY